MEKEYGRELMKAIEKSDGNYNAEKIKEAYEFADKAHDGQKRKSGDPYISHPVEVAKILIEYGADDASIIAALLHDTVEDTDVTLDDIKKQFGEEVALLVDGVTKLKIGNFSYYDTKEEQQIENIRKMLLAMAKDIRVIIICELSQARATRKNSKNRSKRSKSIRRLLTVSVFKT